MAREFVPASSQRISFTKSAAATDLSQVSYSFHYIKDAFSGAYREIFWSGGAWSANFHSFVQHDVANYMAFVANWSGAQARWSIANPTDGVWTNDVWTYDFGATTNDPVAYRNGSSATVTERLAPSGTSGHTTDDGTITIGAYDDGSGEYWDGKIAEFGIWNRILSAGEAAKLGKNCSALFIPRGLVFYAPLFGNNSPETDIVGSGSGTVSGATKFAHPPIIYPSFSQIRRFTTNAVVATAIKDLIMMGLIPHPR